MDNSIYKDIADRTGGDIYIGVVGPVRTGKSTFIKQVMENLVLPNIENPSAATRARDEMPQSASGRTVMTTEPKFIPEQAVNICLDEDINLKIKMVDCVGYMVEGALGNNENGEPRMVMTPWSKEGVPFEEAAETGTHKVITEHATIGVMVTTDGTIGELPRENYIQAEKRVAKELNDIGKPFVIVLNTAHPKSNTVHALAKDLEKEYSCNVLPMDCTKMTDEDIKDILSAVLYRFPIKELKIYIPSWVNTLKDDHYLQRHIQSFIKDNAVKIRNVSQVKQAFATTEEDRDLLADTKCTLFLGTGCGKIEISIPNRCFYKVLSEECDFNISDERSLMETVAELAATSKKYSKVKNALEAVNQTGYGIVTPDKEDLTLEEPQIVKRPGGYGVKLKASAPSIHMIKADIMAEVSPMVGSETQSEELVQFMLKEFEEDPARLWETNMFGKTLYELIEEGLTAKLAHMPDDARHKLSETLQRIINEGSGGLICILL